MVFDNLETHVDKTDMSRTRQANRKLPDNVDNEFSKAAWDRTLRLAKEQEAAGNIHGRQARIINTFRAKGPSPGANTANPNERARTWAGGPQRVGRHRTPASNLVMGSEFGSSGRYRQFGPPNPNGWWFFKGIPSNNAKPWSGAKLPHVWVLENKPRDVAIIKWGSVASTPAWRL